MAKVNSVVYNMTFKLKPQGVFIFSPVFKEWRFRPYGKKTTFVTIPVEAVRSAFKRLKKATFVVNYKVEMPEGHTHPEELLLKA